MLEFPSFCVMRHLDGLSIQSFINWVKTFFRVSRIWSIAPTWSLARPFTYLSPFISQILDFLYWMVSISIFDGIKVKKENWCTVWNESINPLSPNIHTQILQTDLHTFPLRISWENLIKGHGIFSKMIILLIRRTLSLDSVWILLGENCCWSLLELKGLTESKLQ